MGRLVRSQTLNGPMIHLQGSNSCIQNVWIDGRAMLGKETNYATILWNGAGGGTGGTGSGVKVNYNRISDTHGWAAVNLKGVADGYCNCSSFEVNYNLLTGYATDHLTSWADGISVTCEDTHIIGNQLIDITDGSITIYRGAASESNSDRQQSYIYGNYILNAGNSAVLGIGLDPGESSSPSTYSYSGTEVSQNTIWSSPSAHINHVFELGTRYLYTDATANIGNKGVITNNGSGNCKVATNICQLLDGFTDIEVHDNNFSIHEYQAFRSNVEGMRIMNSNTSYASKTSNSSSFNTMQPYPFFDNTISDHTGLYIKGGNDMSSGAVTLSVASMDGQSLTGRQFDWVIKESDGTWITTISGSQSISVQYTYDIWVQMYEQGTSTPVRDKFVFASNAPLKKASGSEQITNNFILEQNYPNPFNPSTIINYAIKNKSVVTINIYNILGEKVTTLLNEVKEPGNYKVNFDGTRLSSGVYIYTLQTDGELISKKMLLMK